MGSFMAPLEAAGEAMSELGGLGQEIAVREQKLRDAKLVTELEAESAQLSAAMEEQLSQAITSEQAETIRNAFQADFASIQERVSGVKSDAMRAELGAKMELAGGLGVIKIDSKRRDIDLSILQNEVSRNINNVLEQAVITGDFAAAEAAAMQEVSKLIDLTLTEEQAKDYVESVMGEFQTRSVLSQLDGENWRDVDPDKLKNIGYENQLLIRGKIEENERSFKEGRLSPDQLQWNRGHDARVLRLTQGKDTASVVDGLDKAYKEIDRLFADRPDDAMLGKRALFAAVTREHFVESAVLAASKNAKGDIPDASEIDDLIKAADSFKDGRTSDEKRIIQAQINVMSKIRDEVKSENWDQILTMFSEEEKYITEVVDRFMELEVKDRWNAEKMQRELMGGPSIGGKTRDQWEAEGGSSWLYGRVAAARRAAIATMASYEGGSPSQKQRSLKDNPSPQNAQSISSQVWPQRVSGINGEALPPTFVAFEQQLRDSEVPEDVEELLKWSETYQKLPAELSQWLTLASPDSRFTQLRIEDRVRLFADHGIYPSDDPIEVNAANFKEAHLVNGYLKKRKFGMDHEEAFAEAKLEVPPDWKRASLIGEAILGSSDDTLREKGESVVRNVINNLKDNGILPRFDGDDPTTGPESIEMRLGQNTDREFAQRKMEAGFMDEYSELLVGIASSEPELMDALARNSFTPHQAKDLHARVAAAMLTDAGPDGWSPRGMGNKAIMTTHSVDKAWRTKEDDAYGLGVSLYDAFRKSSDGFYEKFHVNVQSQMPRSPGVGDIPKFLGMANNMRNDVRQHSLGEFLTSPRMIRELSGRRAKSEAQWVDEEQEHKTGLDYAREYMQRNDLVGSDGIWAKDGESSKPFSPVLHEGVVRDGDEYWAEDDGVPVEFNLSQHVAANWRKLTEDEVTPGDNWVIGFKYLQEKRGAIAHNGKLKDNVIGKLRQHIAVEPVGMVYDYRLTEYNNTVSNLSKIGKQTIHRRKEGLTVYRAFLRDPEEPDGFARDANGDRVVTAEFWETPETMLSNPELIYQLQNSIKTKYGTIQDGNANNTSAFGGSREDETGRVEAAAGP